MSSRLLMLLAPLVAAQIEFFTPPARPPLGDLRFPAALNGPSVDARGLFQRQLNPICTPTYPQLCPSDIHCCGRTHTCCTAPYCCEDMAVCITGGTECCPLEAETCGDPNRVCAPAGSICCGDTVCASTDQCILNEDTGTGLCCFRGEVDCGGVCCPRGSVCDADRPGVCGRAGGPRTSSATRTGRPRETDPPFISDPEPDDPRDLNGDDEDDEDDDNDAEVPVPSQGCDLRSTKKLKRRNARGAWVPITPEEIEKRQIRNGGDDIGAFCDVDGDEVPVIRLEQNEHNSQLLESICRGIESLKLSDEVALTWAGDDGRIAQRKSASGCLGFCNEPASDGSVRSCHQFPFASVLESSAHKECIPAAQNTLQGAYLAAWAAYYEFARNQVFVLSVDCSGGSSTRKFRRQNSDSPGGQGNGAVDPAVRLQISGKEASESWIEGVGEDQSKNRGYLVLPIGDANIGSYEFNIRVTGDAAAVRILNSAGQDLGSSRSQSLDQDAFSEGEGEQGLVDDERKYTFELSEEEYGVGAVVYARSKNVGAEVDWKGVVMEGGNVYEGERQDGSGGAAGLKVGLIELGVGVAGMIAWAGW